LSNGTARLQAWPSPLHFTTVPLAPPTRPPTHTTTLSPRRSCSAWSSSWPSSRLAAGPAAASLAACAPSACCPPGCSLLPASAPAAAAVAPPGAGAAAPGAAAALSAAAAPSWLAPLLPAAAGPGWGLLLLLLGPAPLGSGAAAVSGAAAGTIAKRPPSSGGAAKGCTEAQALSERGCSLLHPSAWTRHTALSRPPGPSPPKARTLGRALLVDAAIGAPPPRLPAHIERARNRRDAADVSEAGLEVRRRR
jgi:hypothetical protein